MKHDPYQERSIPRNDTYPGLFAIRLSENREIVATGKGAEEAVRARVAEIRRNGK